MDASDRLKIRGYLEQLLAERDDRTPFDDEESLIAAGRLDSLAVVKLVIYLETEFGVDFARVEFDPQRFDTLAEIGDVIEEWRSLA